MSKLKQYIEQLEKPKSPYQAILLKDQIRKDEELTPEEKEKILIALSATNFISAPSSLKVPKPYTTYIKSEDTVEGLMEQYRERILSGNRDALIALLSSIGYPAPYPHINEIQDILYVNGNLEIVFNDPEPQDRPNFPRRRSIPGHRVQQFKYQEGKLVIGSSENDFNQFFNEWNEHISTGEVALQSKGLDPGNDCFIYTDSSLPQQQGGSGSIVQ